MQINTKLPKTNSINFLQGKYCQKQKQQTNKKYKSVIFLTNRIAGLSALGGRGAGKEDGSGGAQMEGEGNEGRRGGGAIRGEGQRGSCSWRYRNASHQEVQYNQYINKQVERQGQIIKNELSTKQKIKSLRKPIYRTQYPPKNPKTRLSTSLLPNTGRANLTQRRLIGVNSISKINNNSNNNNNSEGGNKKRVNGCSSFGNLNAGNDSRSGYYDGDYCLKGEIRQKLKKRVKTCYEDGEKQSQVVNLDPKIELTPHKSPQKPKQLTQQQKQKIRQKLKTQPKNKVIRNSCDKLKIKKMNTQQSQQREKQCYVEDDRSLQSKLRSWQNNSNSGMVEGHDDNDQQEGSKNWDLSDFIRNCKFQSVEQGAKVAKYLQYARKKDLNIISNLTKKDYQILQIITNHLQKPTTKARNGSNISIDPVSNPSASHPQPQAQVHTYAHSPQQNSHPQQRQQGQQFKLSLQNENSPRTRKTKLRESYEKYYNKLLEEWHDQDVEGEMELEAEEQARGRGEGQRSKHKEGQLMVKDKDNKYVIPKNGLYMSMYMRMHNTQLKYPVNFKQNNFGQTKKSFKQMVIKTKTNMDKYLKKRQSRYNSIRNGNNKSLIKNYSYTQIHSMYKNLVTSPRYQSIQNFYGQNGGEMGRQNGKGRAKNNSSNHNEQSKLQYSNQQIYYQSNGQQQASILKTHRQAQQHAPQQQVWLSGKGYADPNNTTKHPNPKNKHINMHTQTHTHMHRTNSNYSSNNSNLRPYLKHRTKTGNQHISSSSGNGKYNKSQNKGGRYNFNSSNIVVELVGPTIKIDPW